MGRSSCLPHHEQRIQHSGPSALGVDSDRIEIGLDDLGVLQEKSAQSLDHGDDVVRGVAEKAVKENAYHRRHSRAWVVRLGDGTEESRRRMLLAVDELWPLTAEIAVDGWREAVTDVLVAATLPVPAPAEPDAAAAEASATARRELLAEMQSLARAHPGATW